MVNTVSSSNRGAGGRFLARLLKPERDFSRVQKHVVFFHGLNGSCGTTFQSSGEPSDVWPLWLNDCGDEIAVWGLDYGASATRWQSGNSMALPDRAQSVLPLLASAPELSAGDFILVGYSMGGLVIKQLLRLAEDERGNDARIGSFIRRVRKVAFLATPHFGSDQATLVKRFALFTRPRETTAGLGRNDAHLRDLNRWYRTFSQNNKIENLVLYEMKSTSPPLLWLGFNVNIGTIVKPDSSDPGLPQPVSVIPIDADHLSIVRPSDRDAEVYVHIRDFVSAPISGAHADTYLGSRLEAMSSAVQDQGATIAEILVSGETQTREVVEVLRDLRTFSSEQAAAVAAGADNPVVTAELARRITRLRKLRYVVGFDALKEARGLFEDVRNGELVAATRPAKRLAGAWCARVFSNSNVNLAEAMLTTADSFGTGEENDIAAAFLQLHRDHDKAGSLAKLAALSSPLARAASVIVASHGVSPAEVLSWFDNSGLTISDLDPDGKFFVLHKRLETGQWSKALEEADTLKDADFETSPILLTTAASVHLSAAIHDDLKPAVIFHLPLDLTSFHLATDNPSLARRRLARDLFERAAAVFAEFGVEQVVALSQDYSLWLRLRDGSTRNEALRALQASMSGPPRSLRRVPFAIQFDLQLDPVEVERQIDQQMTLTGGRSPEAAIARFALARAKKSPADVAAYIGRHRDQLTIYFRPEWIDAIQVEALARSGQVSDAQTKLAGLQGQLTDKQLQDLQQIIDEEGATDPIALREAGYRSSGSLADLILLVDMLRAKKAWPKLATFGGRLFESTKDISTLRAYVEALFQTGDYACIIRLAATYEEMFAVGGLRSTVAWSNFRLGDMDAAKRGLGLLGTSTENPRDTWLAVNLAVTIGDWNSLSSIAEEEWSHRSERDARDLLQMGHLATLVGLGRAKDLIKEAAKKANGDVSILVGCYSEATNAGWEDDPDVHQWLDEAIKKSGDDGPIQRVNIKQLLDMQPTWNEQENRASTELSAGRFPTFAAGLVLRRPLLGMHLIPALSNLGQPDPRRRPIIFAFNGARHTQVIPVKKVALDPTAILTLAFLGLLEFVRDYFDKIVIPPNILGWLLEERRKVQFHQPSRVRAAFEVKRLLDNGLLKRFEPVLGVKPELEQEVGTDLALMLAAAADEVAGDQRQRVVVRPYPLHRMGTLMNEFANVAGYESHLAGCRDLVSALRRLGYVTAAEEKRCTTYLGLHELPWPHSPTIHDNAVLFLDDVTVAYLQHLRLLDRIKRAGFTVFVSTSGQEDADVLVNHEAFSDAAQAIVEDIRRAIADGFAAGKIGFGAFPHEPEGDPGWKNHPSACLFDLAPLVDGFVVDDRALNLSIGVSTPAGPKGMFSTLDVLLTLQSIGALTVAEVGEHITKLRRAGFALVPTSAAELLDWLSAALVIDGRVVETAELKAIRETILRVRMTDVLQLPLEHVWLDGLNIALMHAIRDLWTGRVDDSTARACSDWLLSLFDIRGWLHRMPAVTGSPQRRYGGQAFILMNLVDAAAEMRPRYWKWLEDTFLTKLRDQDGEAYAELTGIVKGLIAEATSRRLESARDHE